MATFVGRLQDACRANRSLLCVGLDPDPSRMPLRDVAAFNRAIVEATADLVCAYKPNLAFYEALGMTGLRALEETLKAIRKLAPSAIVIGDAKRGDIGNTAQAYAAALFDVWGFDAATVNPYLGGDSVEPFLAHPDRGAFIVCRTSNPGAREFQDLRVPADVGSRPLYEAVALKAQAWNTRGNVGLVVGATYLDELKRIRALCPTLPILIPGVGAQGGDVDVAVINGTDANGRLAVLNSSRGIIYASRGADYAQVARKAATALRDEINAVLARRGQQW